MSSRIKRSPHDFVFKQELGNGSYSRVYKAVDRSDGQRVFAVKVCSKRHIIHEDKVKYVTIEKNTLNLLARAHHPGIVKLYSTFHDEENLYFVLDFAAGGELLSLLHRVGRFTEAWARHFIAQLIDTTEFIHSQGVIHRDLKPENVLLHRDGRLMVTDFGTATSVNQDNGLSGAASFVGTAEYVSPELLLFNQCLFASDVWALGCMLYQFIQGAPPFRGENELQTFEKIVALEYPWANSNTGGVVSLVRQILTLDPSQRPALNLIKKNKWFEHIDWSNRETLWRGIWQVQPPSRNYNNSSSSSNLPLAKQKRRKPAKVGNTTSSIVEWRRRLGIETGNHATTNTTRKNVKQMTNNNTNDNKNNNDNNNNNNSNNNTSNNNSNDNNNNMHNKPVRTNSMIRTQAMAHVQEQAELQARMRAPLPKTPGNVVKPFGMSRPTTSQRQQPIPKSVSSSFPATTPPLQPIHRAPTAPPPPLSRTPMQPQPSSITRPPTAPNFQIRSPSPVNKVRPPIYAPMPRTASSPLKRADSPLYNAPTPPSQLSDTPAIPAPVPSTAPSQVPVTAPAPAPAPVQVPSLPPMTKSTRENVSGSSGYYPTKQMHQSTPQQTIQPAPTQTLQPPSIPTPGKPMSSPPKTAPPKLSLDTNQRPSVLTNGSTAVMATSSGGRRSSESGILKQDLVHIFEIPFNNSGPDISLQSYKRVDNSLITKLVAEHKSELKPKDQQPAVLTLFKDGTLQYRQRNSGARTVANIGDTSLSLYDFEFYERQCKGFLILEKYHHKVWFISLPGGFNNKNKNARSNNNNNNNNNTNLQLPIIGSDENWVDCIFAARQLIEDQGLADRLNNVEVSSPRLTSPTIPVTPIYTKSRTPSSGSNTPKRYFVPNNMVVSSSRSQVLHALNRNAGVVDASMGASAAFKSLQKK